MSDHIICISPFNPRFLIVSLYLCHQLTQRSIQRPHVFIPHLTGHALLKSVIFYLMSILTCSPSPHPCVPTAWSAGQQSKLFVPCTEMERWACREMSKTGHHGMGYINFANSCEWTSFIFQIAWMYLRMLYQSCWPNPLSNIFARGRAVMPHHRWELAIPNLTQLQAPKARS